jgi:hypothetical protein
VLIGNEEGNWEIELQFFHNRASIEVKSEASAGVCVFDVVLLLLTATAAAGELSSQSLICQVTCDYWCSPPLLLLCVFSL